MDIIPHEDQKERLLVDRYFCSRYRSYNSSKAAAASRRLRANEVAVAGTHISVSGEAVCVCVCNFNHFIMTCDIIKAK